MKGKILITDSLFIFPEHEQKLRDAGFEIERLDTPEASEDELIAAIKGKVGYILGGTEKVTEKVIDAGDMLKVIVFTGIGYKDFIPAHEYATQKGIVIANTPDAPTYAVAEWAVTMALAMNRNIFELGRMGDKKFMTSKGIEGQRIGIIGLGRIGKQIASMLPVFRPFDISYYSQHIKGESGLTFTDMNTILKESDIVFVCVSKDAGEHFIGKDELALMKDGALLINTSAEGIINDDALIAELQMGRIRAAIDHPFTIGATKDIPLSTLYYSNSQTAFNTFAELKLCSEVATETMINLMKK